MTEPPDLITTPLGPHVLGYMEELAHDAFRSLTGREPTDGVEHASAYCSVAMTALTAAMGCIEPDDKSASARTVLAIARAALTVLATKPGPSV